MSMRPNMPTFALSRRAKIALSVVAILIVLIIVLFQLAGVYVNYLWYHSFDNSAISNVYSTQLWTKVVLFVVFGALMALILGGNLVVAYLVRPPFRPMSSEQQNLQNYALMIEPRRKLILAAVAIIAFLSAGASAQGNWQMWQLFLHGGSWGITDPQFHLDISFYAWDYPAYRSLLGFGFTAIIFSIVLSVIVHYLTGAVRLQTPGPKVTIAARRHLTVLVFVFMALKAIAYWLDRYGLVFSNRSKFTGASYTDVHSALPAKTILFWITIVLALGVLASMWLQSAVLPFIGFVVLLILSILMGGVYPAIVQAVSVNPNASVKEAPYIRRNIEATRAAYGIQTQVTRADGTTGTVKYVNYDATANPDPSILADTSNPTVDNIRILDPYVLPETFTNQQKIQNPFGFTSPLSVDRYKVGGQTRDYIVGARALLPQNIQTANRNWINEFTVYTHGLGLVAAPADKNVTKNPGLYTEANIPPAETNPLGITNPQIYYGQGMAPYAIVGASGTKREFNGNGNPHVSYQGAGGVSLSNFFTRLAYAADYKQTNFLLNDTVSAPGAKIIYNRDPSAEVQKVAPFLTIDGSPYPIVDQSKPGSGDPSAGHIVWMVDGYTTSAQYPYSERQSLSALTGTSRNRDQKNTQINYIRNSVKATVDAYTGKVTLYDFAGKDPVLDAWKSIFPGLIQPESDMPTAIKDHVRYPQDLFNVQRALLANYHVSDPVLSYNGTNRWSVPDDPNNPGSQPSYYVLAAHPGSENDTQPEFQLTSPMPVINSTNLAAYISADSDPGPGYGKITVLQVQKNTTIPGPTIVSSDLNTNPTVKQNLFTLGGGQGQTTSVIHGNLLTLPLGGSFLYVEPLYSQSGFPQLARVAVYYPSNNAKNLGVGYGNTLQDALNDLIDRRATGASLSDQNSTGNNQTGNTTPPPTSSSSTPSNSPTSPTAPTKGGQPTPTDANQLLQELNSLYSQYNAAIAAGNTQRAVIVQGEISSLLEGNQSLIPSSTPAAPTSSPSAPRSSRTG